MLKKWILSSLLLLASCSPSFAGGSVFGVTTIVSGGGSSTIQANNNDQAFASGTVKLSHYIYERTTSGTATTWVKFPTLAPGNNTQYYFYYNNASAVDTGSFSITFTKDYQETGLVGLWHFDEGSFSTTALDSSGNANTGTLVGLPTWLSTDGGHWDGSTTTKFNAGSSLSFNGVSNYITIADSPSLTFTNAITISFWAYIPSQAQTYPRFINKGTRDTTEFAVLIEGVGGSPFFRFYTTAQVQVLGPTMAYNATHHIVAVYDGATARFYLDNVSGTAVNATGNLNITATALNIGRSADGLSSTYAKGIIDEVRIYNRALSPAEITALYERRKYSPSNITITYGTEETGAWDIGGITFSNRRPLTVNNTGATALTDFQVKFQFKVGSIGTNVL